jgi:acetolactate synthase I/II/III large subunit
LLAHADLVVAVGVDALEPIHLAWSPATPVVHLSGTSSARTDWILATEVIGDIALVIEELAPRLRGRSRADWDVAALDRLKRQIAAARPTGSGPARVVALARDATPAGTTAAADGGLCAAALAAGWPVVGPSEFLVPAETGPPVFAAAAALAAQLARPERRALAFTDSAGLADDHRALDVALRLGAPVVVIVLEPADASASPAEAGRLSLAAVSAPTEAALARALAGALAGRSPCLIDTRGGQSWRPSV